MYIGPGLRLAPHHNVAATIAVALREPFEVRTWARSTAWSNWKSHLSAMIPSETLHHLRSSGPMAFLYLDPLTDRRHLPSQAQLDSGRRRLLEAGARIGITEAFAGFGLQPRLPGKPPNWPVCRRRASGRALMPKWVFRSAGTGCGDEWLS
jgi:hypothetical protein